MTTPVLDSVRDLIVVNSNHHALKLSLLMRDGPKEAIHAAYAGSARGGYFYLYRNDAVPGMVMETVVSPIYKDGITSIYQEHRIFESKAILMRKREDLITELANQIGLSPEAIGIEDEARGRSMSLQDLSTGQLIDMVLDRSRGGIVTMKTDNFNAVAE